MLEDGNDGLFQAVNNGDLEEVKSYIQEDVDLNVHDSNGQTPLIIAAEKGYLKIVIELILNDVDSNAKDEDGWTALIAASKEGHGDIVAVLLEYGAKYTIADLGGWTPLVWASYKGFCSIVKDLLKYGANPNEKGQHNMTALIWASGRGHAAAVAELIQGGAEPEVADKYGTSALIWACRKGHYDVIKLLVEEGANCNNAGTHGWTPLIMAAKGGFTDVVTLLLAENSNVNAVDQDGRSALAWSAKEGFNEIVIKLLQKGAFLNMPDRHGDSPLILAAKEGQTQVVHTLVASYADIEMVDAEGKTPLYVAVEKGHVGVVNELLSSGANTESMNKDEETPLMRGAKKKHTQCVKLLLEKGANVNVVDKKGDNVLHVIIRNKFIGMCELLLNDPKHTKLLYQANKAGETPYSIDGKNKPGIISQICNEGQVNHNDFGKMDLTTQQDILLSTLGNFLVEPSLSIPMTVGMYSRWGSGKSAYIQRLVELLQEYKDQVPFRPFTITLLLILACITCGINFGIIIWAVDNWKTGIVTGSCLVGILLVLFSFGRLSMQCANINIRKCGIAVTVFFQRFMMLLKLIYCVPPSIEEFRPILPVHLVMADLSQSIVIADSPMASLVSFTRELNDAVELDIGIFIPRLYRVFRTTPYRNRPGTNLNFHSHWKVTCCCIPSFVITIFIFSCLWIAIILYHIYGIPGPSTVIAIQIACCIVLGGGLIVITLRCLVSMYSLCLPMKKRVKIVSNQAGIQEETFLQVLKQEIDLYVDMLECLDGFNHRQTRIVIHIDLVDSLEQQKVLSLINTINLLVTEPGHPFILVLSVDPRLLIKAVDQTLSNMQGPVISPCEYLKNMVDLPFYINEYPKLRIERVIPHDVCNQLEDKLEISENEQDYEEVEWIENNEAFSGPSHINERENGHVPLGNGIIPMQRISEKSVKFPSNESLGSIDDQTGNAQEENISEDISHLLRNNENNTLNDVKRIMNIVSLNGRLLRGNDIPFQWTRLAIWVSFCDGWPYKASWITLLCLDTSLDLPGNMSIRRLHSLFGFLMPIIGDKNLGIENSNTYFDTFIGSHRPVINVGDARSFSAFMFYIDPTIRKLMIDYLLAMKTMSSLQPSVQQQVTAASTFPTSPNPNDKFLWRNTVNAEVLVRMTVDDVASQLLEIEGMDETLLQSYKTRLMNNNINGRVLVACDLNELRDAMQMKFGDWQLFKAWITSSRNSGQRPITRCDEKTSTDQSTSCLNSCIDGSQSESNPGTPKQSACGGNAQNPYRLPALSEKVDNANVPYSSHSPRGTPPPARKLLKLSKASKSVSQDSESGSPHHANDHLLHHSADSGFASTEVDQNHRLTLTLQRQMCVSEYEKSNEHNEKKNNINHEALTVHIEECKNSSPLDIEASASRNIKSQTRNNATKLSPLTINETDLTCHSFSNERLRKSANTSDHEYSNIKDDYDTNESDINNIIPPPPDSDTLRPPSLSDVPLPPLSMLNDDLVNWPMNPPAEFDDIHDNEPLPSPPSDFEQIKLTFRNTDKTGNASIVGSLDSEHQNLLSDDENSRARSEPYSIDFAAGNTSSLKKSASAGYHDNRNSLRLVRSASEKDGLIDHAESSF